MWKKRVVAYIIDMLIISTIINIFGIVFPQWSETSYKSQEEINRIFEKQTDNGKAINDETFNIIIDETTKSIQRYDKELTLYHGVEVMILFGYFIILPMCANGQTVGKKLFKIKVTNENGKLTYKNLIIRTLLITEMGALTLTSIFVYILPSLPYFIFKDVLGLLELVILIVSLVKIIRNEKHLGLHDMIAKTEVVEI